MAGFLSASENDGQPRRFRVHPQGTGGHRPHCGRVRHAAQERRAEFSGAVSLSPGEDAVVLGSCHAAVLSLLRLRRLGRCFQFRAEDREHHLSGSSAAGRREAQDPAAEDELRLAGGGAHGQAARRADRHSRARLRLVSGATTAARGSTCPRVSCLSRTHTGADRGVSHRLRARSRLSAARCDAETIRRRGAAARVGAVFVERKESVVSRQSSAIS